MQGRRPVRVLGTSAVVLSMLLAGCAPGLAANPRFATDSGAHPQGQPQTTDPPQGPPPIEARKNDLSWRDCTSQVFSDASVAPVPGVKLDCATYDADLDPIKGASGTISIGVVRAKTDETPEDAGPLVMTTGSDLPTSMQLPVWLSRSGCRRAQDAADRGGGPPRHRHVGRAGLPRPVRPPGDARPGAVPARATTPSPTSATITQTATTSCTDTIAPGDSAYDNCARRRGHRAAAQHLGRTDAGAARHRQRRPGGAGLRGHPSEQGGAAGARLPAAAGHRGRSRDGTARQGRTVRTGCLGGSMRGHQLPVGSRPQGRGRCAAEPGAWVRRDELALGGHRRRRDRDDAGLPARRPRRRRPTAWRRRWRAPARATGAQSTT